MRIKLFCADVFHPKSRPDQTKSFPINKKGRIKIFTYFMTLSKTISTQNDLLVKLSSPWNLAVKFICTQEENRANEIQPSKSWGFCKKIDRKIYLMSQISKNILKQFNQILSFFNTSGILSLCAAWDRPGRRVRGEWWQTRGGWIFVALCILI